MIATLDTARRSPWSRALRTELTAALAMPVARAMLVGSVVLAVISGTANLVVLDSLEGDGPTRLALHSATVPALVFALLAGAYASSTDRRFGFIDQRLLTDPSRTRWLRAKAIVLAAVGVGYGILGAVTAIVTSIAVFALRDASFDVTSTLVARSLLGVVLASGMFALVGTAVGSLTANTTAVVASLLVWVLVIEPPVVLGLPEVGRLLPSSAGLALTFSPDAQLLGQIPSAIVLAAYATLAVALATRSLARAHL